MEAPDFVAEAPEAPVNFAAGERVRLRGVALASVLASLMLTLFLAALDGTIVNTALPSILRDINGYDRYTWPIISYLLTSTTMVPIMGKLSDQFGRKWFLVIGVVVFLAGSALSGASKEFASLLGTDPMNMFIIFRGFQGLGGGTLMGLVFTLIGDIFTPAERAKWQGLFTAVFALSSVFGPTAGGYITDTFGWPWIFYVNLPLGILALFLLIRYLPTHISPRTNTLRGWAGIRRIDFMGALLAAGATVCLVLALTFGGGTPPNGWPWDSTQIIGLFVAAGALLVFFLLNEAFLAREPILPLDLFKNQIFAAGALLSIGIGMALYAVALYLPLFIQDVMGKSATESGFLVTPLTLSMAVTAIFGGQIIARVGRYQWLSLIGAAVMGFGIYLMSQLPANADIQTVIRDMIVTGLGLGMVQPVLTLAVQNAIPRIRLGTGTGAVTYLRSMGQLLGIAIVGAVANNVFSTDLTGRLPASVSQLPQAARAKLLDPTTLQQVLGDPSRQSQAIQLAQTQADSTVVPQIVQQQAPAIIQQQLPGAIAQATANIPAGPNHAQQVAIVTQQVTAQVTQQVTQQLTATVTSQVNSQVASTLHDIFSTARLSLAVAIDQAFLVGVGICVAIFIVTIFLKDVPLVKRVPATVGAVQATALREAAAVSGEALPAAAFESAPVATASAQNGLVRPAGLAALPVVGAIPAATATAPGVGTLEDLTWGALGLTLASLVREAESAHADPRLLGALSEAVDGRYPHSWTTQERAQAVARDMVEPLAQALLSAYVGSQNPYGAALDMVAGNGHAKGQASGNEHANGNGHASEAAANGSGFSLVSNGVAYNGNGASNGSNAYGGYPGSSNGSAHGATNGHTSGAPVTANGNGAYPQPRIIPTANAADEYSGEYPTVVQPRKKVRVTRRLVVDGHVIGEQALEDLVPVDADTEVAAAALRARLDAMAQPLPADDMPTLHQG